MKEIKFGILNLIFNLVIVATTAVVILLCVQAGIIGLDNIFSFSSIAIIFGLMLITIIFSVNISSSITMNIKKLEKNMKAILDGKIVEIKSPKRPTKIYEMNSFISTYKAMMEIVKRNNFALNSEASKTEIILEHMADGVIAFSVIKDVIHMNKSAMTMLGLDFSYDTYEKIKSKLNLELNFDQIIYLSSNKSIEQQVAIGDNILNLVFLPFFNASFRPTGIILIIRNITESMRLENLRKEFVANVSHEFKTPLTSIKGYSETMMRSDLTKDEVEDFARVINQEANRMDRLVVNLLQLSKFDNNRTALKKVHFNLADLSKLVAEKMKFTAAQKEHELVCEIIKPTKIYADKDSIEQVLLNIVSNSIKYTPDGGKIKISIDNDSKDAYIKIIDNGIGIPQKDLDRIFERFYRVDKARSRKMGGTGLGLAIVKEIVDSNGGKIDITSEVDKGTKTVISLPLSMNN